MGLNEPGVPRIGAYEGARDEGARLVASAVDAIPQERRERRITRDGVHRAGIRRIRALIGVELPYRVRVG